MLSAAVAFAVVGLALSPSVALASGNWNPQAQGNPNNLSSIAVTDLSHGWAVGVGGTVLCTTDGGAHWTPQVSGITSQLNSVSFADASRGWAVGWGGNVRSTSDGGAHWTSQASGTGQWLTSVACAGPANAWALGGSAIRVTTDGGAHWTGQSSGTAFVLFAETFADVSHGWAVGEGGTIVSTADGGAHWTSQVSGTTNYLNAVAFTDASHGWAVGAKGTIVSTVDGGEHWTSQNSGTLTGLSSVAFTDVSHGWAVGGAGTILSTADGGATWTSEVSGTSAGLNAVAVADDSHAWAVGDSGTVLAFTVGPATKLRTSPAANGAGWYRDDVLVSLDATEGLEGGGPKVTMHAVDGGPVASYVSPVDGPVTSYTTTFAISAEGAHILAYSSIDASGNAETTRTAEVDIDRTPPQVTGAPTVPANAAGWHNAPVTVRFAGADSLSGVAGVSADVVLASDGASQSAQGSATDAAGNTATGTVFGINVDTAPPTTSDDHVAMYAASAAVDLSPTDSLSGVASTAWTLDGVPGSGLLVTTAKGGTHTLRVSSTDIAGNVEPTRTITFAVLDDSPPVTSVFPLLAGWSKQPVTFWLSATDGVDGSGVAHSYYALNGSAPTTYTAPVEVASEGVTAVSYFSVDMVGNVEPAETTSVAIDLTPPVVGGAPTTAPNAAGWHNAPVTVRFSASDTLSGVAAVSPDLVLASDGASQSAVGAASDIAGNSAMATVGGINIDSTPPSTDDDHVATYTSVANIRLHATDALSGVAGTAWTLDGDVGSGALVSTSAPGNHTLAYASTDIAGNAEPTVTVTFAVVAPPDTTPPATTIHGLPSGWVDHDVEFSLTTSDTDSPSGISTFYGLDAPALTPYAAPVTVSGEGTTTVSYFSVDASSNAEEANAATVRIDKTPPTTSDDHVASYVWAATVRLSATDGLSGVATTTCTLDGGPVDGRVVRTSVLGPHTLAYSSADLAGNAETTHTLTFTVIAPPRVTTSVSRPRVSASSPRRGKSVVFSATLVPGAAALSGASKLLLCHSETKTVTRRVRGKKRTVKVTYWRLRSTLALRPGATGKLSATGKLAYSGKWQMYAAYAGSPAYLPSSSAYRAFRVR